MEETAKPEDPQGFLGSLYRILMTPVPPPPDLDVKSLLEIFKKLPQVNVNLPQKPEWLPDRPER